MRREPPSTSARESKRLVHAVNYSKKKTKNTTTQNLKLGEGVGLVLFIINPSCLFRYNPFFFLVGGNATNKTVHCVKNEIYRVNQC